MLELSKILEKTRSYINDVVTLDAAGDPVEDDFANETDMLITAHIDSAVKNVASVVPTRYLVPTVKQLTPTTTKRPDDRYVMTVQIPSDCMRFVSIIQAELKRPISEFKTRMDASYNAEWCEIPGIGSGDVMPSAYVWAGNGNDVVELHSIKLSSNQQASNVNLTYIEVPKINSQSKYNVSESLIDAIALAAGASYLGSIGEQTSVSLAQQARNALLALGVESTTEE